MSRTAWLAMAASALLAACASPPVNFYTLLAPGAGHAAQPAPAPAGVSVVQVLPVSIPAELDLPQIVVRSGQGEVVPLNGERWAGPLADQIRVTYKTAWLMLHKLRSAMSRHEELDRLTGLVRLDLGISGPRPLPWVRKLGDREHPFVIGGSMEGGPDGRVLSIKLMQDTGGDTYRWRITPHGALRFIEKYVDSSRAEIDLRTDSLGRTRVFSLYKITIYIDRAMGSTHQGVGAKHRQAYLNEYAYRFNRSSRGQTAERHLLHLAAAVGAPTQKQLKNRPVPDRPDWDTYRDTHRMIAEFKKLAARLLPQAS